MIRAVAVVSLVLLLVLVLYVPAAHPPERFLGQLRSEHEAAVAFWGPEPAYRMLDRAMRLQSGAAEASPLPAARDMPRTPGINGAVAIEMASVNQRLFNNAYFRSVDALLMLASYRLSSLLEWLPWLLPLVVLAADHHRLRQRRRLCLAGATAPDIAGGVSHRDGRAAGPRHRPLPPARLSGAAPATTPPLPSVR